MFDSHLNALIYAIPFCAAIGMSVLWNLPGKPGEEIWGRQCLRLLAYQYDYVADNIAAGNLLPTAWIALSVVYLLQFGGAVIAVGIVTELLLVYALIFAAFAVFVAAIVAVIGVCILLPYFTLFVPWNAPTNDLRVRVESCCEWLQRSRTEPKSRTLDGVDYAPVSLLDNFDAVDAEVDDDIVIV